MRSYHIAYRRLPAPKGNDPAGNLQLSWRVSVLPYVEEELLHGQIALAEPWDSPTNQAFANKMPSLFGGSSQQAGGSTTCFQVFTGPNTPFPNENATPRLRSFLRSASETILLAEAASPVPWMKPADMNLQPGQPLPLPPGSFVAAMADGSVRLVDRRYTSDSTIRLAIDPNVDQLLPPDW